MDKEERKRILKQMQREGREWTERVPVIKTPLFSDAQMAEYGRQMAHHHKQWIQSLLDSGLTKQDLRDCDINPD